MRSLSKLLNLKVFVFFNWPKIITINNRRQKLVKVKKLGSYLERTLAVLVDLVVLVVIEIMNPSTMK